MISYANTIKTHATCAELGLPPLVRITREHVPGQGRHAVGSWRIVAHFDMLPSITLAPYARTEYLYAYAFDDHAGQSRLGGIAGRFKLAVKERKRAGHVAAFEIEPIGPGRNRA